MRRGREIVGLPVIDLSNGERIAQVIDLVCNPAQDCVSALLLSGPDQPRGSRMLLWENIYSLGVDAVTVESREAITLANEASGVKNQYLAKNVLTSSGKSLGRIEDIAVDAQSGRILGCVLTDGLVGDFLTGRSIIPLVDNVILGEENMIVPDEPTSLSEERGVNDETDAVPEV